MSCNHISVNNKQISEKEQKDISASIATTNSSGKDFKYNEDGRSYHGNPDVKYVLPNDDDEKDRLHQQHWLLRHALQSNHHAPVTEMLKKGITVLDAACGPATWTFEMARDFPESKFTGADISFVFPELIRPANVDLVIGNITQTLPFPDNTFDYIHQRMVLAAFTDDNWNTALKELYRILKPGGYVELVELDIENFTNRGPHFDRLQTISNDMFYSRGFPVDICTQLEERSIKIGFINQVQKITDIPLNHGGKIGELLWKDFLHAYGNARPTLAKSYATWEDIQEFNHHLDLCSKEAAENKSDLHHYVVYAQKPALGSR